MIACAGYTAYCLAPPVTPVTFDVLDREEIRFFKDEREQLGKISDVTIIIDDTDTNEGIISNIIELLGQTKEINDEDEIGIVIFIQLAFNGASDTTVRELVSSFGFSKEYQGKYCVPDNEQLRLLQASIAEVDEASGSLMYLIATYEDYKDHEKQINEINEREKMYREYIRQINQGEDEQAAERNLTLFLSDHYSRNETFIKIVIKRLGHKQPLIAGNTIPASAHNIGIKRTMPSLRTSQ